MTLVSEPHVAPEHPVPDRLHVTPWFSESFCSVAVNGEDRFTCTLAVVGATLTTMGTGVTVIVALDVLVVSVTDVAVNVTVAGLGTLAGAV